MMVFESFVKAPLGIIVSKIRGVIFHAVTNHVHFKFILLWDDNMAFTTFWVLLP